MQYGSKSKRPARNRPISPEIPVQVSSQQAWPLSIVDALGEKKEGLVFWAEYWDQETESQIMDGAADFRIVILRQPSATAIRPPAATVVCAPAGTTGAVTEPSATYSLTGRPFRFSHLDLAPLGQGTLHTTADLRISASYVFQAGDARFDLLARDLLLSEALEEYLGALRLALAAPEPVVPASLPDTLHTMREIARSAEAKLDKLPGERAEAGESLQRVARLAEATLPEDLLSVASQVYPLPASLCNDVYLLRALIDRLAAASEFLTMRRYVQTAEVDEAEAELCVDRALALQQLQFVNLIVSPQALTSARMAFEYFQKRYHKRYQQFHDKYWQEMERLHSSLLDYKRQEEALRRLNTLRELGPPLGALALDSFGALLEETAPRDCPEEQGPNQATCAVCRIQLGREAPAASVSTVLGRIDQAVQRQAERLSSVAVRRLLQKSHDTRVEHFLKVLQAAQPSSLIRILDDDLAGYLRRFLVEARLDAVLNPILERLEKGPPPKAEEAREALREMAQVLQRAFRSGGRSLSYHGPLLEEPADREQEP